MSFGLDAFGTAPFGAIGQQLAKFNLDSQLAGQTIIEVVSFFDRRLIEELSKFPEGLRQIGRREFECLIAELFAGFGYEVELTRQTRDGGKDIIAIKRQEVNLRYLIECKRPEPGNAIAVSTVRELWGVKTDENASKAILATTTYFTADAKKFSERHKWELELCDYDAILGWINRYVAASK